MSISEDQIRLSQFTRVCQIIAGALIAGVMSFMAFVALVIDAPQAPAGAQQPAFGPETWQHWPLTSLAIALAIVGLMASFVVPRIMVGANRRGIARGDWPPPSYTNRNVANGGPPTTDADKLATLYHLQLIIGSALNEGVAIYALLAYMLERQPVSLAIAMSLILVLASRFPTLGRTERWIEAQQDLLLQDRQSAF